MGHSRLVQMQDLTIVIPVLNDAPALMRLLPQLPEAAEIVVVDGGSQDLAAIPWPAGVRCLNVSKPGRGSQLRAGIEASTQPWIWLLHADSLVEASVVEQLGGLEAPAWGRFDVRIGADSDKLRLIGAMMNLRSRWTGICTGDQGIFVHRSILEAAGGMPCQPLMEDIELSRRLRRQSPPRCLPGKLQTSARRWHQQGIVRTVLNMWWLRFRYWCGANPERLAARYYA